ncbi:hypothetical protein [Pseudacidovorax intermedius]|uniref:hypothetical protein n=1 Tax=Pseudacidovorax intermedius TaxID=433924 RepID=UPI0026F0983E|nr:hypothetical protein [Pseudacidovorax intermedius]
MDLPEVPDGWATKLAGIGGAFVSMGFIKGTLPARAFMAIGGALLSFYFAPWVSAQTGLPEGGAGFLLGLFGMAVVSRIWESVSTWQVQDLWQIAMAWLRRVTGIRKEDQ